MKNYIWNNLSRLNLTHYVSIGFVLGCIVGVFFRFFPSEFLSVGVNVAKFNILGKIFIDLIKMIIAPLIFCSICSAILSIEDGSNATKLAIKTILVFLVLTSVSVIIGMLVAYHTNIGGNVSFDKQAIIDNSGANLDSIKQNARLGANSVSEFIMNIIPNNIFDAFLKGDFLQIIFFATIFSIATVGSGNSGKKVSEVINAFSEVIFAVSDIVTRFAPIGIFGIASWLIGTQDIGLIKSLGVLVFAYYGCALFLMYPIYGLIFILCRINPIPFFKKMLPVQLLGYVTASSAATVPLAIDRAQKKLGVTKEKANFIIPLGATINMNGGAIHFGMSTIFIANLWGVHFVQADYITIFCLSIIGAVGTAPIPGVSIFLLAGILAAVNLPIDAIAIILAVDRILDMMRTVCNISGDSFAAVLIDKFDKTLDKKIYYDIK